MRWGSKDREVGGRDLINTPEMAWQGGRALPLILPAQQSVSMMGSGIDDEM